MVFAVGVAVCGLVAAARPARSWAHPRAAALLANSREQQVPPPSRGHYPDVDIQLIDDYENASRKPKANPGTVRIHMDIDLQKDHDLSKVRKVLNDPNSTPDQIFEVLTQETIVSDNGSRGAEVVKAALGKK